MFVVFILNCLLILWIHNCDRLELCVLNRCTWIWRYFWLHWYSRSHRFHWIYRSHWSEGSCRKSRRGWIYGIIRKSRIYWISRFVKACC